MDEIVKRIEAAHQAYSRKHMRQPTAIRLRMDTNKALHESMHAFLFDFIDTGFNRERFMGMDVTLTTDGPEFEIPDGTSHAGE
jgi:hypothetical protein